jgi:hypothetical protein
VTVVVTADHLLRDVLTGVREPSLDGSNFISNIGPVAISSQ